MTPCHGKLTVIIKAHPTGAYEFQNRKNRLRERSEANLPGVFEQSHNDARQVTKLLGPAEHTFGLLRDNASRSILVEPADPTGTIC